MDMNLLMRNVLAALLLMLSGTLLAADKPVFKVEPATVASASNSVRVAQWYKECEDRVAAMAGKPCDIVFIGDSITQAGP